ncbi:MAG: hypothetical protein LBT05_09615 [Planctomycetaceae bacterium]|nr:hypothetical protein [Planctomycetaceae bacterium]
MNSLMGGDGADPVFAGLPGYARTNPFLRRRVIRELLKNGVLPQQAVSKTAAGVFRRSYAFRVSL